MTAASSVPPAPARPRRGARGLRRAPPRLSSFLRAFGTSRAPTPADVDAAYVARGAFWTRGRDAPSGDSRGGGGGGGGARGGSAPRGATRAAAPPRGSPRSCGAARARRRPADARARRARDVLSSVVAVAGGDTLLPDELRDAALVAFEAAAPFAADAIEAAREGRRRRTPRSPISCADERTPTRGSWPKSQRAALARPSGRWRTNTSRPSPRRSRPSSA